MLSVQYRLAPEHPHPVPVEDAYAGLTWLAAHAGQLGIDPGRIAVMGDSAGGGLAASAAILSRDRQGPAVARQLLIYPMLDDRTTTPDPYIAPFAGWSYDDNATGWNAARALSLAGLRNELLPLLGPGRLDRLRGRARPPRQRGRQLSSLTRPRSPSPPSPKRPGPAPDHRLGLTSGTLIVRRGHRAR